MGRRFNGGNLEHQHSTKTKNNLQGTNTSKRDTYPEEDTENPDMKEQDVSRSQKTYSGSNSYVT